jgi:hypothetical protein
MKPIDGRSLLVVKQPILNLSQSLIAFRTDGPSVHVLAFPNVLSTHDIQELSKMPTAFSLEVVEELAEVHRHLPQSFDAVHFHGFLEDSINLRAFTLKVAASMKNGVVITGLPEGITDLLKALMA